jgi:predicted ArsR family transcriptional regulator
MFMGVGRGRPASDVVGDNLELDVVVIVEVEPPTGLVGHEVVGLEAFGSHPCFDRIEVVDEDPQMLQSADAVAVGSVIGVTRGVEGEVRVVGADMDSVPAEQRRAFPADVPAEDAAEKRRAGLGVGDGDIGVFEIHGSPFCVGALPLISQVITFNIHDRSPIVKKVIAKYRYDDGMDEPTGIGDAQRRIVDHLKRAGASTTTAIADALGVTTQAVRPQLVELEERGLVNAETVATGTRGRPPIGWALSSLAIELFPDRHGDLTVELLTTMRSELGEDALDTVLAARDAAHLAELRRRIAIEEVGDDDIGGRVAVLADQRSRQGYMAEVVADGDDLVLIEHHCPVCAAATTCQNLCRNELELFRAVIGEAGEVERTQHLLSGDERCVYRIRTRPRSA